MASKETRSFKIIILLNKNWVNIYSNMPNLGENIDFDITLDFTICLSLHDMPSFEQKCLKMCPRSLFTLCCHKFCFFVDTTKWPHFIQQLREKWNWPLVKSGRSFRVSVRQFWLYISHSHMQFLAKENITI